MLAIIIIGYCLFGIGFAVITEERAEALGYDHLRMWFWFGFFGLFIALIAVNLQDENKSEKQNGIFTISCLVLFGIAFIFAFYKFVYSPYGSAPLMFTAGATRSGLKYLFSTGPLEENFAT